MTVKETIEIIRESSLWQTLSLQEKVEALAHAVESAEKVFPAADENTTDIAGIVHE